MSETITACENIGRDFSWIGPLTEWLRNIAIIVGVVVAWRQLNTWKREKISIKRAELGEELVAITNELCSQIGSIRSPMGYGPPDGEEDDGTYDYRRRLKEIAALDVEYVRLRQLKVRARAYFGDEELTKAVDALFDARIELVIALQGIIRMTRRHATRYGQQYSEKDANRQEKYERVIWSDMEDDSIGPKLNASLKSIEEKMIPHIRLEASR